MDCKLRFYSRKQKNNKFGIGHFIMAEHKYMFTRPNKYMFTRPMEQVYMRVMQYFSVCRDMSKCTYLLTYACLLIEKHGVHARYEHVSVTCNMFFMTEGASKWRHS